MLLTLSLPEWIWESLKVVLTFESVDKILWCDYSNQTSLPILLNSAICFENFIKQNLGIFVEFCPWPHLPLKGVIVRPRYTLIRIFLKMEIRFSLPSHVKDVFELPRDFWKARFSFKCWRRDDNGGFRVQWCYTSYTTSIMRAPGKTHCRFVARFSVFMCTGGNDSSKRHVYLTCGGAIFGKRKKNISVFKNIRILVDKATLDSDLELTV